MSILRMRHLMLGSVALLLGTAAFVGMRQARVRLSGSEPRASECSAESIATMPPQQPKEPAVPGPAPEEPTREQGRVGTSPPPETKRGERLPIDDRRESWDDLPIGDGRNLGPYVAAFQFTLTRSPAWQGIRDHCVYDGVPRAAGGRPCVLVLNVATTPGGFKIERAKVRDAEGLDEYQQECVTRWLTGVELEASGVEPGRRYRVTYPIRLGLPERT